MSLHHRCIVETEMVLEEVRKTVVIEMSFRTGRRGDGDHAIESQPAGQDHT